MFLYPPLLGGLSEDYDQIFDFGYDAKSKMIGDAIHPLANQLQQDHRQHLKKFHCHLPQNPSCGGRIPGTTAEPESANQHRVLIPPGPTTIPFPTSLLQKDHFVKKIHRYLLKSGKIFWEESFFAVQNPCPKARSNPLIRTSNRFAIWRNIKTPSCEWCSWKVWFAFERGRRWWSFSHSWGEEWGALKEDFIPFVLFNPSVLLVWADGTGRMGLFRVDLSLSTGVQIVISWWGWSDGVRITTKYAIVTYCILLLWFILGMKPTPVIPPWLKIILVSRVRFRNFWTTGSICQRWGLTHKKYFLKLKIATIKFISYLKNIQNRIWYRDILKGELKMQ